MEENQFAVHGTMRMLEHGDITLEQATSIVNIWIELTAKKFYSEGVLDGLRRNTKTCVQRSSEAHQRLCDLGIR